MRNLRILVSILLFAFTFQHGISQIFSDYYGIFTDLEEIYDTLIFVEDEEEGGHIWVWNGFSGGDGEPFYGDRVLTWKENPGEWDGFGIHSDIPLDLSNFDEGFLRLALKTSTQDEQIEIGIQKTGDPDNIDYSIIFNAEETPYDFVRDGEWHELSIPLVDFKTEDGTGDPLDAEGLNGISIVFYLVGNVDIDLDEIYFSQGSDFPWVSVSDHSLKKQFKLFPNPVSESITIHSKTSRSCAIEIASLNGQHLLSEKMEGTVHEIDLSSFQKGAYFITIRSMDIVTTRKIIKL